MEEVFLCRYEKNKRKKGLLLIYILLDLPKKHTYMLKKITILSSFLFSASFIFAQATPNFGFESWTAHTSPNNDTPDGWDNLNPATGLIGTFTCFKATAAADVYSGTASLRLVTKNVAGQIANGIATTGTINTVAKTVGGGIPYTLRPDSIIGHYKYTAVSGDNGFAEMQLLGSGGDTDTVGFAHFSTPTTSVGTYTRFSTEIIYRDLTSPVVKSIWILSSSKDAIVHNVGSTIYFDNVSLVFAGAAGIAEQSKQYIRVGPNPTDGKIIIEGSFLSNNIFNLYDLTGRKVFEKKLQGTSTTIDLSEFEGLTIYSITDDKNNIVKTNKLIIQK